jgi:hypothetical protein
LFVLHQIPWHQDSGGEPHGGNGNERTHGEDFRLFPDLTTQRAKNELMPTGRVPPTRRDGKKVVNLFAKFEANQVPRGFARRVAGAESGSSGQGCLG